MKIAYLTWGETPRTSGVFGSQAIGQLLANKEAMPDSEFFFISAVPLIHSGLLREKKNYSKEIEKIKERLSGVPFFRLSIYAPQNFIFSSKKTFELMHLGTKAKLARLLKRIEPDVVHCRSYHAAYAALKVKEAFGLNFSVVFDPRGIWSEEVALRKGFVEGGEDYVFLKKVESWILRHADATVSVSSQMAAYFESLGATNSTSIYLSAPVEKITKIRSAINVMPKSGRTTIAYLGTLGNGTWHRTSELIALYKHLQKVASDIELMIITMSNPVEIAADLKAAGVEGVKITSAASLEELVRNLASCHLGVLSYFNPETKNEKLLSSVVMAVKTAEYLAAGLPILVNKLCGGAAGIVEAHAVGIAYDPDTFAEIDGASFRALLGEEVSERAVSLAGDVFDYRANAERYSELYRSVLIKD